MLSFSPVVRTVAEAADRPYAYIICAFKYVPEVTTTPALLAPLLAALTRDALHPTTFVLLQNGIGIEDDLLAALAATTAPAAVISGCCWVDVTAVDGGRRVVHTGTRQRLVLGYHRPPLSDSEAAPAWFSDDTSKKSLEDLCSLFRAGGSVTDAAPDADIARWRKVLW